MERRKRLSGGGFGELEKIGSTETPQEKIERLEATTAQVIYESMMKDMVIEELSNNQAGLTYQLMMKGVI